MDRIAIDDLTKDYGQGRGIFGVSFSVHKGECFGFLGPNGAGKSTTIRHLMGFSTPDKGYAAIDGVVTVKDRSKALENVGYLPGEISLPGALTGREFIKEQSELKGLSDYAFADWLTALFQLDTSLRCKDMSMGMKRKLTIVVAFMSDPDILVMDEPSSGLDPKMQEVFIELVKAEKKRGKTILMSSHIFSEIDSCCDRIAVIKDGKIVSIIDSDVIKHNEKKNYRLRFKNRKDYDAFANSQEGKSKAVDRDEKDLAMIVNVEDEDINTFLMSLKGLAIDDLSEIKLTLEDYFMSFYKEDRTFGGL